MNIQDLILNSLTEKALNLGNRSVSYPKFGQILILAGGAGSGKGFASQKVLAFEGKRFDVDELKSKIVDGKSKIMSDKFMQQYGRSVKTLDLKNSEDVSMLHDFVDKNGYDKKVIQNFLKGEKRKASEDTSISGLKQNIIFDVTLKNIKKLQTIYDYAMDAGYEKKNIHIVWILNDMEVAWEQNKNRSRVVARNIFVDTHSGASETMHSLIQTGTKVQQYMDGDIWVLFNNQILGDLDWVIKDEKHKKVGYVNKYTALQLKRQGQKPYSEKEVEVDLFQKIKDYVPVNPETGVKAW